MSRSTPTLTTESGPANFVVSAARPRILAPLRELDIAPENLRYSEPPDEDVPLLAETLFAAGQLQPLTVRPGRKKERAHMALDGRRRIFALRLLLDAGRISDDFLVDVFVETDPARQAAAVLLTNTAVPVHVSDVIAAIGRMLKGRLGVAAIARALGYAELDVKRLAALAALPPVALDALKAGRLNLRQARLLARLPDQDEQAELARMALDGHGFQDWRVTEKLDADQVSADDARCLLAGLELYTKAGGRMIVDLFGERPPALLDPAILTDLWTARAREIALVFEAEALEVHVSAGDPPELPDDLETAGYVYGGMLSAAEMAAYRDARERFDAAGEAARAALTAEPDTGSADLLLIELVRARIAMDQAGWGGRIATVLVFRPSRQNGLDIQCFTPVEPEVEAEAEPIAPISAISVAAYEPPVVDAAEPETEGVNHALHSVRTDVATRGLIRALADAPDVAVTALIARLFNQLAVRSFGLRSESALSLTASAFKPTSGRVIDALDGEVRQRLDGRRADWEASGQTVIGWVHGLAQNDKTGLLAELTALTLDVREERTSLIRKTARAEAAELAQLCGADITRHWTPDAEFLKAHSKPLLLKMLEEMNQADVRAALLKKTDLIPLVEESAAAKCWAPSALSWSAAPEADPQEPTAETDPAAVSQEEQDDAPADEPVGRGAFEVTPTGEAALHDAV